MNDIQWKTSAILICRKLRTYQGNLATCVRAFRALSETQQASARIVVPGCIQLAGGHAVRTLTGTTLAAMAHQLPTGRRTAGV